MKYFRKLVEQYIIVNDKEWDAICAKVKKRKVLKNTLIHRSGEVFADIWFVKSGLSRSYFTDVNGKDFTWQLYFRGRTKYGLNHFLDDSVSFYENEGSMLNFETLEDSVFYTLSLTELDAIITDSKKWEHLARIWLHDTYFASTYKRVISLMSETAKERYERLLNEYPSITTQVKSYHIASYLGIAPQTLSKLKNESR